MTISPMLKDLGYQKKMDDGEILWVPEPCVQLMFLLNRAFFMKLCFLETRYTVLCRKFLLIFLLQTHIQVTILQLLMVSDSQKKL